MPVILGILAALVVACIWIIRVRNAAEVTSTVLDAANDVRLAARRFGFRRQADIHPVDTIEDPKIAVATLAVSFLELDDYPSSEQKDALIRGLCESFTIDHDDAVELVVLARWIMGQCKGPAQAIPRVSRKLFKLSERTYFETLMKMIKSIAGFGDGGLSGKQKSALEDIQHGLKIS